MVTATSSTVPSTAVMNLLLTVMVEALLGSKKFLPPKMPFFVHQKCRYRQKSWTLPIFAIPNMQCFHIISMLHSSEFVAKSAESL